MIKPPRPLSPDEIEALLALDIPARLATLDAEGFPHVTPLWFIWAGGAFHLTSYPDRPHLRRLGRNPRAGLCIDVEEALRNDGQRPNRQLRAIGIAELFADEGGAWTRRIDDKYVHGAAAEAHRAARAGYDRVVIRLKPTRLVAVASFVKASRERRPPNRYLVYSSRGVAAAVASRGDSGTGRQTPRIAWRNVTA